MEPQIVDQAKNRPGRCLASRDVEGPFIDVGVWTREHDPYLYLSVRWFKEVGKSLLDLSSPEEVDEHLAYSDKLEAENKRLRDELASLESLRDSAKAVVASETREARPEAVAAT
jgi:hypothetical protein